MLNHIFTSLKKTKQNKTKEQLWLLFFKSFTLSTELVYKVAYLLSFPILQ